MNSFIGWVGGKRLLREEIVKRFPAKIGRYIEVFGGAGWVLFQRERHAEIEVYNDINGDLVNLFRCVKYHCPELQRELSFMLNSREMFEDAKVQFNLRGMTDIQRAARFFILVKTSYGSIGRTYGCSKKDIAGVVEYLAQVEKRLSSTIIENRDFEDLIRIYDKPDALLYLDPPYYEAEGYYMAEFKEEDHVRLISVLRNIKGKFILSYNDCEFIRELYQGFVVKEISRNNNLTTRYPRIDGKYKELLILNF